MKKIIITLIILLISNFNYAIERVAGTKVSINVPTDFVKASRFLGYVMTEKGASIMVVEIPGPFSEVSKGFSKKGCASQGMTLLSKQEVKIESGNALLLNVSQSAQGINFLKWILAFGNSKETVLILGTFPKKHKEELSNKLKKSILSARWNTSTKVDLFEGLTFKIKEDGELNFATKIGNNILLTRKGTFPQKRVDAPLVIAGVSMTSSWNIPEDKKKFAENRLRHTKILVSHKIVSGKEIKIDGMDGYLIEGEGKDKDTLEALYIMQCILFDSGGYYIFQGMVGSNDSKKYRSSFTTILNSFKRNKLK